MPLTPRTPGSVSAPTNLTEEAASTVAVPVNLTEESAGAVAVPVNLTEESAASVAVPTNLTEQAAASVAVPVNLTEEAASTVAVPANLAELAAGSMAVPNNLTEQSANTFPRALTPLLSLDFDSALYAQNGAPTSLANLITYNRASSASYVDRYKDVNADWQTVIKEDWVGSITNSLTYSEDFSNAAWTKSSASVSTDSYINPVNGQRTAQKIVEDSSANLHFVRYDAATGTGNNYFTVYAKYNGRHVVVKNGVGTPAAYALCNLITGRIAEAGGADLLDAYIQPVGDGWMRVGVRLTSGSTYNMQIELVDNIATSGSGASYTGDGESGVYIFGAMMSNTDKVPPYVRTTSASASTTFVESPRIEYDPATGEALGMLNETASTNLYLNSERFTGAANATATYNSLRAPDNTFSATLLVPNATSTAQHEVGEGQTFTDNTIYTFSFFAKAAGYNFAGTRIVRKNGTQVQVTANLLTGAVGFDNGNSENIVIQDYGNGWYRIAVTFDALTGASSAGAGVRVFPDATFDAYAGDTTSGVYIWGAQIEASVYPTSYIRTEGATVARSSDDGDFTNKYFVNPFAKSSDLSIVLKVKCDSFLQEDANQFEFFRLQGADLSSENRFRLQKSSSGNTASMLYGGAAQATSASIDSETESIIITVSDAKVVSIYFDGVIDVLFSGSPENPISDLKLSIMQAATLGHIKEAIFYDRALTRAEISQL